MWIDGPLKLISRTTKQTSGITDITQDVTPSDPTANEKKKLSEKFDFEVQIPRKYFSFERNNKRTQNQLKHLLHGSLFFCLSTTGTALSNISNYSRFVVVNSMQ